MQFLYSSLILILLYKLLFILYFQEIFLLKKSKTYVIIKLLK